LQASYKTKLPFEQLTSKAREADILPGLKTPLVSINKIAEEGYTTVFHPGEKGVTIHKPGTISITITKNRLSSKGANQKEQNYGQYKQKTQIWNKQIMHTTYH
jgi:hypothetical protein